MRGTMRGGGVMLEVKRIKAWRRCALHAVRHAQQPSPFSSQGLRQAGGFCLTSQPSIDPAGSREHVA